MRATSEVPRLKARLHSLHVVPCHDLHARINARAREANSSLKPADKYGATVKAKINLAGERAVKFYSAANEPCEAPTDWKGLHCNAVVCVKGVYIQRQGVGLLIDVTHLQYTETAQGSPFDAMEI